MTSTERLNWYTWETVVEVTPITSIHFHARTKAGSINKASNYFKRYAHVNK